MNTIEVQVQADHLERLANSGTPIQAVCELIWNSLDADATSVIVSLERDEFENIVGIVVSDNGTGITIRDATDAFEKLGGSWKSDSTRTDSGRILHGKQGKGRFLAFTLGNDVTWSTRCGNGRENVSYAIHANVSNLKRFELSDPEATALESGTTVSIIDPGKSLSILETQKTRESITQTLALYLKRYPEISVTYDGGKIDPASIEKLTREYAITAEVEGQSGVDFNLIIVEWWLSVERKLFLCDSEGFSFYEMPPGIHAPGYDFTAYLKAKEIRELSDSGELSLLEMNPVVRGLIHSAKAQMRSHFRDRAAEETLNQIERWKSEDIYPFSEAPESVVEEVERQVFDVVALNVQAYLPDFETSSQQNKKLSFRLLRSAIEKSPEELRRVLSDVLTLPAEKQQDLIDLLERTSLESIIGASKEVGDRLDFLKGLEVLLFNPEGKKHTLERAHLHKIVAEHTWLFGEEFNLTVSDQSLTSLLKKHLDEAEVKILDDSTVVDEEGATRIVDLVLSRRVPQPRPEIREHLVVELKRPSVSIGSAELSQVKSYAQAIASDERFLHTDTKWEFWAVSNDLSEVVKNESSQVNRPLGLVMETSRYRVWVKTWGQIIDDSRARLNFFQEHLRYAATESTGLEYLRNIHKQYLPVSLKENTFVEEKT